VKILWNILLVVLALAAGMCVMMPIEHVNNTMYPLPPGVSRDDMAAIAKHVATMPAKAFILVWISHFSGPLVASFLAARFSAYRSLIPAYIVGCFYLIAGIAVAIMLGASLFFVAVDLPLYPLATALGIWLGKQKPEPVIAANTP
jgi:hypothetical protein